MCKEILFGVQDRIGEKSMNEKELRYMKCIAEAGSIQKAAVLRIVKVDASNAVCPCCRRMGIRRTNVAYSCEDQLKLSLGTDVFQLVPIMSVLGNIRME